MIANIPSCLAVLAGVLLLLVAVPAAPAQNTDTPPPTEALAQAETAARQAAVSPDSADSLTDNVAAYRARNDRQLIRPGDLVDIRMKEDVDINYQGEVSAAGLVSLPFLGHYPLAGVSEAEAEERLQKALTDRLYERATISVTVLRRAAGSVYVYGAVQEPGKVPLPEYGSLNVMQTLSEVGGVTRWADPENAYILREDLDTGESAKVQVNIREVFQNVQGRENVVVRPSDILFVPATVGGWDTMLSRDSVEVIVTGRVTSPGSISFAPGERATFMRAIFKAGNFARHANRNAVRWIRQEDDGERSVRTIDAEEIIAGGQLESDFELQSGDMIIVPQTPGHLYVYGAVEEPGRVAMPESGDKLTILQVLSEVGGVSRWAAPEQAYLMRREAGQETRRINVNISEAFTNIGGPQNMELNPSDVLFVPAITGPFDAILSSHEKEIIVTGAVQAPGLIKFQPGEECTFVRAIFKAGNFTKHAKENQVRWVHYGANGQRVIKEIDASRIMEEGDMNQDFELSPGDMIIVPQSNFNF